MGNVKNDCVPDSVLDVQLFSMLPACCSIYGKRERKKEGKMENVKNDWLLSLISTSLLKSETMLIERFCGDRLHAGFYA